MTTETTNMELLRLREHSIKVQIDNYVNPPDGPEGESSEEKNFMLYLGENTLHTDKEGTLFYNGEPLKGDALLQIVALSEINNAQTIDFNFEGVYSMAIIDYSIKFMMGYRFGTLRYTSNGVLVENNVFFDDVMGISPVLSNVFFSHNGLNGINVEFVIDPGFPPPPETEPITVTFNYYYIR